MSTSSKEALHAHTAFPVLDLNKTPHRVRILPKSTTGSHSPDKLGIYLDPTIFHGIQSVLLNPTDVLGNKKNDRWYSVRYYFTQFLLTLSQQYEKLPQVADEILGGWSEFQDTMVAIVRFPWEPQSNYVCKESNTSGYLVTYYFLYSTKYVQPNL